MLAAVVAPLVRVVVHTLVSGIKAIWQGLAALVRLAALQAASRMAQNSVSSALLGCSFATAAYVGLLYIWRDLPRDHPSTIKCRMLSAWAACAVSWVPLALALRPGTPLNVASITPYQELVWPLTSQSLAGSLGLRPSSNAVLAGLVLRTLGHGTVLFALPLWLKLARYGPSMLRTLRGWLHELWAAAATNRDAAWLLAALGRPFEDQHLWLWRNMVVSPVTEEFVFRACMAPLLLLAGCSQRTVILATPLFFGVAHLHHLADLVRHRRMQLQAALLVVAAQFTYTTVFGWYATWLFVKTGSLWSPVATHVFCNWLGVPDLDGLVRHFGKGVTGAGLACSIAVFAVMFK